MTGSGPRPIAPLVFIVAVGLVGLTIGPGIVAHSASASAVTNQPDIGVYLPDHELTPGEDQPIELQVQNDGTSVDGDGTVRNVTVALEDGPFAVTTNTTPLGSIPDGETIPAVHHLTVPADVDPGTYQLTGSVNYSFVSPTGERSFESDSFTVVVTVPDEPRFRVHANESGLEPGAAGTIDVEIENVGGATAHDLRATLRGGGGVTLGDGEVTEAIGTLNASNSTTVSIDASIAGWAGPGDKPIEGEFAFTDADGIDRTAGPVTASLAPLEPNDVSVVRVESDLTVGLGGELRGTIRNDGPRTIENAVVTLDPGSESLLPSDARVAVGDVGPWQTAEFRFAVDVPETADYGDRTVDVAVDYGAGDASTITTDPSTELVRIHPMTTLEIGDLNATLAVGQDGEIVGTVRNDAPRPVDPSVLVLDPGTEALQPGERRYPLPALGVGEEATFRFPVTVGPEADPGPRDVDFRVEHHGFEGSPVRTAPVGDRVTVAAANAFSIENVSDTLAVGYDGEITGEVRNDGPTPIDDGVLIIEPMSDSLYVEDTRYALPDLTVNESTTFRYPTDVSGTADDGPRQVRFTVEYGGADGAVVTTDPLSERVLVDPRTDEFEVSGVQTELYAGESAAVVLEITNTRPETLSNIDAMVYTDSPLSAPADQAFVPELAPNESAHIDFELAAASDARASVYPIELDFQYRTERGETELSDTYQVPIDVLVDETDDGGDLSLPLLIAGVLVVGLGIVAAAAWWRRRE